MERIRKFDLRMFDEPLVMRSSDDGTNNIDGSRNDLSATQREYYVKTLLTNAKAEMVHNQFAQKRPIPSGNGKRIVFRKMEALKPALTPIVEGKVPVGSKLSMKKISTDVSQYGDFVRDTDILTETAYDPVNTEICKAQAVQAGQTEDILTRDVMQTTTNVIRVGNAATKSVLEDATDVTKYRLTVNDIITAVNKLKRRKVQKIDGYYVAIIHPDVEADLMRDPEWREAQKYVNPNKIYEGEIGTMFGCRFVVSTNAKIYKTTGKNSVYGCLFLGANAYGVTNLGGLGLEYIIKPKGYNDELNLVGSAGWKTTHGAVLLNSEAIIRYECLSSLSAEADTINYDE